jgi:hypothetical protein
MLWELCTCCKSVQSESISWLQQACSAQMSLKSTYSYACIHARKKLKYMHEKAHKMKLQVISSILRLRMHTCGPILHTYMHTCTKSPLPALRAHIVRRTNNLSLLLRIAFPSGHHTYIDMRSHACEQWQSSVFVCTHACLLDAYRNACAHVCLCACAPLLVLTPYQP